MYIVLKNQSDQIRDPALQEILFWDIKLQEFKNIKKPLLFRSNIFIV